MDFILQKDLLQKAFRHQRPTRSSVVTENAEAGRRRDPEIPNSAVLTDRAPARPISETTDSATWTSGSNLFRLAFSAAFVVWLSRGGCRIPRHTGGATTYGGFVGSRIDSQPIRKTARLLKSRPPRTLDAAAAPSSPCRPSPLRPGFCPTNPVQSACSEAGPRSRPAPRASPFAGRRSSSTPGADVASAAAW